MKYFILLLILIGFVSIAFAMHDPNDPNPYPTMPQIQMQNDTNIIKQFHSQYDKIEFIDGKPFFVSEKYDATPVSNKTITFHGVNFLHPSYPEIPNPGGFVSTAVTFEDGTKKSVSVGFTPNPIPVLTERKGVFVGMMRDSDGLHFLVSADLIKISPLKQFKSGIAIDQIQCREGFTVVIKKSNGNPNCIKYETLEKLRERGWAKFLFEIQIQHDQTNSHFNSQKTQNKFPNVTQRQVVMKIEDQKLQDGALGVTIIDKITRTESSDDVVYIEIVKQWENFKIPEPMFFNITLEGDNTPVSKPFLIQQSLMESHAGPLKDQFYFSLPINVPLFAKAEQGVILFNYTMPDILPKDDKYHLKFASFSDVEVKLPNNAIIIENNTREYSEFWSYDENYALSHKADHLTIDYPSSMDVNSVIIYDITFEIRK